MENRVQDSMRAIDNLITMTPEQIREFDEVRAKNLEKLRNSFTFVSIAQNSKSIWNCWKACSKKK